MEKQLGELLIKQGLSIGTVESATGGLIAARIISVPGASEYCKGGIVAYHNEIKTGLVGVEYSALLVYGAVSSQVAEQMAGGGRRVLGVDICLSDTGIAGPGGAAHKPVGLFYIGLATPWGTWNRKFVFKGKREENRQAAVKAALEWVIETLSRRPNS